MIVNILRTSFWLGLMLIGLSRPVQALSLSESEALMARYHPLIQACGRNPEIADALRAQASAWTLSGWISSGVSKKRAARCGRSNCRTVTSSFG